MNRRLAVYETASGAVSDVGGIVRLRVALDASEPCPRLHKELSDGLWRKYGKDSVDGYSVFQSLCQHLDTRLYIGELISRKGCDDEEGI